MKNVYLSTLENAFLCPRALMGLLLWEDDN